MFEPADWNTLTRAAIELREAQEAVRADAAKFTGGRRSRRIRSRKIEAVRVARSRLELIREREAGRFVSP